MTHETSDSRNRRDIPNKRNELDKPVTLTAVERTLYAEMLAAVCEEMSLVLRKSAMSPNIRERCDFSTALFDAHGEMIAQGTNIPVHLGSMPMSVAAALANHTLEPGDVVVLNDPYCGGTHLPDITVVTAFYADEIEFEGGNGCEKRGESAAEGVYGAVGTPEIAAEKCQIAVERGVRARPVAYLANRAHHADVGGMTGGSLPLSTDLYQEGLILPPVKLVESGRINNAVIDIITANSRTPDERRGDIYAQIASLNRGKARLFELMTRAPGSNWQHIFDSLKAYSDTAVRELIKSLPKTECTAEDFMELPGGSLAAIRADVHIGDDRIVFDFTASDAQGAHPLNAVRAITHSAVFYVVRCLLPAEIPTNAGLMRAIEVVTRSGTIADAVHPAAVAGGNVETSQRIVDVVLKALADALPDRVPASSLGSMNNVTISGIDPRTGKPFAYYETIGGGHGGHPDGPGVSARHAHMTNSLNTPIETLEHAYPLRIRTYSVRKGSGGAGLNRGGDGTVREIEFLCDADLSILAQRNTTSPQGLNSGNPGATSRFRLLKPITGNESAGNETVELPGCVSVRVDKGSRLIIETAGGGGWGDWLSVVL